MNEIIKEIALNAGMEDNFGVYTLTGNSIQDFAERIILQCISQCRGVGDASEAIHDDERFKNVTNSCERMIKQRFGVWQDIL